MTGIDWKTVSVMAAMLSTWGAVILWAVKVLLDRLDKRNDARLAEIIAGRTRDGEEIKRVDRELSDLREALPKEYVRREDWIRFGVAIDAKIDRLHFKFDSLLAEINERI